MMQAEKMLKTLVEEGWFEKSRKGYYSLSPRALMELRGWLMETYNDVGDEDEDEEEERVVRVKLCFACKEIITVVSGLGRDGAGRVDILTDGLGPTMSQEKLSLPIARHLHAEFLQDAKGQEVPAVQDGVDGEGLCRRESSHRVPKFRWREAKERWWFDWT